MGIKDIFAGILIVAGTVQIGVLLLRTTKTPTWPKFFAGLSVICLGIGHFLESSDPSPFFDKSVDNIGYGFLLAALYGFNASRAKTKST